MLGAVGGPATHPLAHGRERPYRNAPRTLDLDILLYGDEHIDLPSLHVPHPRMGERAFVLAPLPNVTQNSSERALSSSSEPTSCASNRKVEVFTFMYPVSRGLHERRLNDRGWRR